MSLRYTDLDNIIQHALATGCTVEVQNADEYGYNIVIDGVPVTETTTGRGLAHEMFGYELDRMDSLTGRAEEKLEELEREYRAAVRRRREDRASTDTQASVHGVDR